MILNTLLINKVNQILNKIIFYYFYKQVIPTIPMPWIPQNEDKGIDIAIAFHISASWFDYYLEGYGFY